MTGCPYRALQQMIHDHSLSADQHKHIQTRSSPEQQTIEMSCFLDVAKNSRSRASCSITNQTYSTTYLYPVLGQQEISIDNLPPSPTIHPPAHQHTMPTGNPAPSLKGWYRLRRCEHSFPDKVVDAGDKIDLKRDHYPALNSPQGWKVSNTWNHHARKQSKDGGSFRSPRLIPG